MRSLIVVTILCLTSTSAFACVFDTDCNPGSTCMDGVCSDKLRPGNDHDDLPSGNAHDSGPMNRATGKTCYYDSDCSQGSSCIKGSGFKGVCIGR